MDNHENSARFRSSGDRSTQELEDRMEMLVANQQIQGEVMDDLSRSLRDVSGYLRDLTDKYVTNESPHPSTSTPSVAADTKPRISFADPPSVGTKTDATGASDLRAWGGKVKRPASWSGSRDKPGKVIKSETRDAGNSSGDESGRQKPSASAGMQANYQSSSSDTSFFREAGMASSWRVKFGERESDNLDRYLGQFESYARGAGMSDTQMVTTLVAALRGRAARGAQNLPPDVTYDELAERVREEWDPPGLRDGLTREFMVRDRKKNETVQEYANALRDLAGRAYAHYPEDIRNERLVDRFIQGQPKFIRWGVASSHQTSISEAMSAVIRVEQALNTSDEESMLPSQLLDKGRRGMETETVRDTAIAGLVSVISQLTGKVQQLQTGGGDLEARSASEIPWEAMEWARAAIMTVGTERDGLFDEEDVFSVLLARKSGNEVVKNGRSVCYFCRSPGHRWMTCFKLRDLLRANGMREGPKLPRKTPEFGPLPLEDKSPSRPLN